MNVLENVERREQSSHRPLLVEEEQVTRIMPESDLRYSGILRLFHHLRVTSLFIRACTPNAFNTCRTPAQQHHWVQQEVSNSRP